MSGNCQTQAMGKGRPRHGARQVDDGPTLHIRVVEWNEIEGYWSAVREAEDGTRCVTPDIWGIRDLDDGIDAAWSRNCDLLISDDLYAEMVQAGDARYPRPSRTRP